MRFKVFLRSSRRWGVGYFIAQNFCDYLSSLSCEKYVQSQQNDVIPIQTLQGEHRWEDFKDQGKEKEGHPFWEHLEEVEHQGKTFPEGHFFLTSKKKKWRVRTQSNVEFHIFVGLFDHHKYIKKLQKRF